MNAALTILAGVIVTLGLAFVALFPLAWGNAHSDITIGAFGVAGAIVALVLPAAGLGQGAAQRVVDAYLEGMAKAMKGPTGGALSPAQWAQAGVTQIRSLRTRAAAARWGSALVYAGFLLSMFSLLQVADPVAFHLGKQPIRPWHLAVAGSLACLSVGAVLFLPLAWWFWTPKLMESSEAMLDHVARPPTPTTPAVEPGVEPPIEQSVERSAEPPTKALPGREADPPADQPPRGA